MSDIFDDGGFEALFGAAKYGDKEDILGKFHDEVEKTMEKLSNDSEYNKKMYGGEIEFGFHPSGIDGIVCARKEIFQFLNLFKQKQKYSNDTRSRRILDNGTYCHERWQNYLTHLSRYSDKLSLVGNWRCSSCRGKIDVGFEIIEPDVCPYCGNSTKGFKYNEYRLRNSEYMLTGKRDGKIILGGEIVKAEVSVGVLNFEVKRVVGGTSFLIEIKSAMSMFFNNLVKSGKVSDKYAMQVQCYMFLDGDAEKTIFIFENKDNQEVEYLLVDKDISIIEDALKIMKETANCFKRKVLPERLACFPAKTCRVCAAKDVCTKFENEWPIKEL